jgi:hypothetical protein
MAYVSGGTLAERLAGGARLEAAEVRHLLDELAARSSTRTARGWCTAT